MEREIVRKYEDKERLEWIKSQENEEVCRKRERKTTPHLPPGMEKKKEIGEINERESRARQ